MKPKYRRTVMPPTLPPGNYRSLPAEIGSTAPDAPTIPPKPLEHPVVMSLTAGGLIPLMEPENGSTLALGQPRQSQPAQPPAE